MRTLNPIPSMQAWQRSAPAGMRLLHLSVIVSGILFSAGACTAQEHVVINTRTLPPGQQFEALTAAEQLEYFSGDTAKYEASKRAIAAKADSVAYYREHPSKPVANTAIHPKGNGMAKGGGNVNSCECWVEPDQSYTTAVWATGTPILDDQSTAAIPLPFGFYLYGTTYTEAYISINGNVSFGGPNSGYTAAGFPIADVTMVAPFWADVDLGGATGPHLNKVVYKVTPTALYVNWDHVGYYNDHTDKTNTFQLIITNSEDPVIPNGANVSFCYKEMQWTTGDANGGTNGFGGNPANVGANKGDGINYLQFGRFDHAGIDYDGPYGNNDGVNFLDDQYFTFITDTTTGNVPPVLSGASVCNYLAVCTGQEVNLSVVFLSPEPDQTTVVTSSAPDFPDYTIITNTTGQSAEITSTFTPLVPGMYQVTFSGTDDGSPSLTTVLTINVEVFTSPASVPVITGDLTACDGAGTVLSVLDTSFTDYVWSNGFNGNQVLVGPGTYSVSAGQGSCLLTSDPVTVTAVPSPTPVIDGVLFNCGGEPATLSTTEPYDGYAWSNGSNDSTISVGTGTYYVTVTNAEGCNGTSADVYVNSANSPTAFFQGDPGGAVFPGTTVIYTDHSNGNGGNLTSWSWSADSLGAGSGTEFAVTFNTPGNYPITLTVTTADGCTHTYTYNQIVIPTEIIIPNVFSPNGDGHNDALVFEGAQYYPNTSLSVFNRWGQEVFTSTNYKNTWRPSKDTPDGTYFYILKLNTGKEYTGNVTLLR